MLVENTQIWKRETDENKSYQSVSVEGGVFCHYLYTISIHIILLSDHPYNELNFLWVVDKYLVWQCVTFEAEPSEVATS